MGREVDSEQSYREMDWLKQLGEFNQIWAILERNGRCGELGQSDYLRVLRLWLLDPSRASNPFILAQAAPPVAVPIAHPSPIGLHEVATWWQEATREERVAFLDTLGPDALLIHDCMYRVMV